MNARWEAGLVEEVGVASSEQGLADIQGLLRAVVNQALVPFIWETEVHFSLENPALR